MDQLIQLIIFVVIFGVATYLRCLCLTLDVFAASGHGLEVHQCIRLHGSDLPNGLTEGPNIVVTKSSDTFQICRRE